MNKNQRTRNSIKEAFLTLIKDEDLETINTKDIMDIVGGARSNFYNYFSDKYELCTAIMQDEIKQMERLVNAFFRDSTELNRERIHELYLIRFRHIYDNRDLYKALFTVDCFKEFPEMLRSSQEQSLTYRFRMYFGEKTLLPVRDDYRSHMMSTITVATIEYWVKTDFSLTPEMICDQYLRVFLPDSKNVGQNKN